MNLTASLVKYVFCSLSRRSLATNINKSTSYLPYDLDRFNGALVRADTWNSINNEETFREKLTNALFQWRQEKRTAAWLWIPIKHANLISVAAELGFKYHNAEGDMAVVNQWLLPTKSLLPRFATHQVGVAGAVLKEKTKEMLIIKERIMEQEFWKLSGGGADLSENIGAHGRSDLYFVCRLTPLSDEIKIDPHEIVDCKWIKLEEAIKEENPILRQAAKQLLFGIQNGFDKIDFPVERMKSVFKPHEFDFYSSRIKKNGVESIDTQKK
ncbi:unnamed protein product [Didymodactylos carnosus]|uniref:Pre-nudix hydrolase domain-containing protein n=1 Tax=Didymodactylos carnosus TaxID=1234261 RepID=A0A813QMM1_9BILA|nr:unnamed protein product [Didymodactylos carnosus]CAF0906239.1 unnamed protein product [Didymodactylos carnosus]CAF3550584.1 unnamed protein product [Didymodactylos carnosus]CAF3686089.1 unnamed protein product [Didymodactylos carnosus]